MKSAARSRSTSPIVTVTLQRFLPGVRVTAVRLGRVGLDEDDAASRPPAVESRGKSLGGVSGLERQPETRSFPDRLLAHLRRVAVPRAEIAAVDHDVAVPRLP